MQAVGVFRRVDPLEDAVGVEVARQRQLHDVAVARLVGVEAVDLRLDLRLRGIRRQLDLDRVHADRLGLAMLHADVQLRRGVCPHEHRRDARGDALGLQLRDPLGELCLDRRGGGPPVEFLCRHGDSPVVLPARLRRDTVCAPRRRSTRGVSAQERCLGGGAGRGGLLGEAGVEGERGGEGCHAGAERLEVGTG